MSHDLVENAILDKGWRVLNLPKKPPLLAPLICARPSSNSILIMGHGLDYGLRHNSIASKVLYDGNLSDLAVCSWAYFESLSDTVYEDIDGRIYSIVYATDNYGKAIEEEWLMSVPADFKD